METRKARVTRRAALAGDPETARTLDEAAPPGTAPRAESAAPETNDAMVSAAHGQASITRVGFAPIVRVNAARREIELCATSEALDSYGTVFDYAASKDAFTRWIGNVREMHERRAVGSRVSVRCDDAERKVYVLLRISGGAVDTWEKLLDGTLRGASIGASNVVWERQVRRVAGRERLLNVATRYDLVELSLVDSPSNPDALGITIVRDAVPDPAVLDDVTQGVGSANLTFDAGDLVRSPAAALPAHPTPITPPATPPATARAEREATRRGVATEETGASTEGDPVPLPPEPIPPESEPSRLPPEPIQPEPARLPPQPETEDADAPPEVRIARQAIAHGWAAIGEARGGTPPAQAAADLNPPTAGLEAARAPSASLVGGANRARGPFSANAEGYPDLGVPARAEERPTAALGMREAGNARERLHVAARGILLGCGCPLCVGALAALGETGAAGEDARRGQAAHDTSSEGTSATGMRELAVARALASGLSASVARMERMDERVRGLGDLVQAALGRIESGLEGARGDLSRRIDALEAQPLPGGPAAFAFEKTLALAPGADSAARQGIAEQRRALESLAGRLSDPQAQIAVAAELIRLQRGE